MVAETVEIATHTEIGRLAELEDEELDRVQGGAPAQNRSASVQPPSRSILVNNTDLGDTYQ